MSRKCVMDNRIGQDSLRRFKNSSTWPAKEGGKDNPSLILFWIFFPDTVNRKILFLLWNNCCLEYPEEEQAELVALKEGKESRCQNRRTYDCHKILQGLRTSTQNSGLHPCWVHREELTGFVNSCWLLLFLDGSIWRVKPKLCV